MSTVTENDLQELKDLIITQSQTINKLVADNVDIKIALAKLEGKIDTINAHFDAYKPALDKVPDLSEKIGELKTSRELLWKIFTAIASLIVGWFLRGVIKI
jgi:small-conductance mechanosensitive channel